MRAAVSRQRGCICFSLLFIVEVTLRFCLDFPLRMDWNYKPEKSLPSIKLLFGQGVLSQSQKWNQGPVDWLSLTLIRRTNFPIPSSQGLKMVGSGVSHCLTCLSSIKFNLEGKYLRGSSKNCGLWVVGSGEKLLGQAEVKVQGLNPYPLLSSVVLSLTTSSIASPKPHCLCNASWLLLLRSRVDLLRHEFRLAIWLAVLNKLRSDILLVQGLELKSQCRSSFSCNTTSTLWTD